MTYVYIWNVSVQEACVIHFLYSMSHWIIISWMRKKNINVNPRLYITPIHAFLLTQGQTALLTLCNIK